MRQARADRLIASSSAALFAWLSDYERYPEWWPEVEAARLLAREGDVAIVELRRRGARQPLVVEIVETRGEAIQFTQVDRDRRHGLGGRIDLAADPRDPG